MNTFLFTCRKGVALVALALAAATWSSGVLAAQPQKEVTIRAAALQAKARHHAELAAFYRQRAVLGSKQQITYFTMANHCDQLARRYRLAAAEVAPRG